MISTLLVGFGFSATTFHLPFLNYLPQFSVDVVISSKPDVVKALLPEAEVYSSLEEALKIHDVDLVVITTPNHLHGRQTKLALEHSCHVLVEKPFTLDSEEAEALVELANGQNKQLCVYQNRRFDGDFLTIKQLIDDGVIGEIKRLESRFDRFRPVPRDRWRENEGPGSGIFWDLGPHLIDQALELFGNPKAVSANIMALRENGQSDDTFDVTLHYGDKVIKLGSSAFQAGKTLRYDVQGTKGSFRKFYLDPQESQLREGLSFDDPGWAITSDKEHGVLTVASKSGELVEETIETRKGEYLTFFNRLAHAIEDGQFSPANASTVVPVIKVIELAIQANEQKQTLSFN
ncbi:oxidoreductase [Alteromonas sp. BL110]|uniref:Gfo/Idh/MocA family oxidoreductase n=1 Tax=Alteromonas sp. BL110 TaxID=1714845 RepID=UPI000E544157|nr:Gfo/Idh/MocA family oxidoreductase [Alteromonas sp. BL110]AXT38713.1 oxidoreductase [Alteromonas sp. BL110]RKM83137.1 oxidoreductase [Alteromonas sp. BL110]